MGTLLISKVREEYPDRISLAVCFVNVLNSFLFPSPNSTSNFQTCPADIFHELRTTEALWKPSPSSLRQRCLTQWWSHTMHLCSKLFVGDTAKDSTCLLFRHHVSLEQYHWGSAGPIPRQSWVSISWWRTLMSLSCWTMKHYTTFVSALWSWLPQLMVTWTIWCLLPWAVSPAACVSLASWIATCARLPWTWCLSHVCTSSWLALHHWPLVALSSIVRWQFQSWPSRDWMQPKLIPFPFFF